MLNRAKRVSRALIKIAGAYSEAKLAELDAQDEQEKVMRQQQVDAALIRLKDAQAAVTTQEKIFDAEIKKKQDAQAQTDKIEIENLKAQHERDKQLAVEQAKRDAKKDERTAEQEEKDKERELRNTEIETIGKEIGMTDPEIRAAQLGEAPVTNKMILGAYQRQERTKTADVLQLEGDDRIVYIETGKMPDEGKQSMVDTYIENESDIKQLLAEGKIDEETAQDLRDANEAAINKGSGAGALQSKLDAIDREYADDPVKRQQARDKALGAGGGKEDISDTAEIRQSTDRYQPGSDNRQAMNHLMISAKTVGNQKGLATVIGSAFGDKQNVEDYTDLEERKQVSQLLAHAARTYSQEGDTIEKLEYAHHKIASNLKPLFERWKALRAKGKSLGKFHQIGEKIANIAGETTDTEIRALRGELAMLMEDVLRIRTGAVIAENEIRQQEGVTPNVDIEFEFSEALFFSMANYTTRQAEIAYTRSLGNGWGGTVAKDTLSGTYEVRDKLKEIVIGKTPQEDADSIVDDVLGGDDGTNTQ